MILLLLAPAANAALLDTYFLDSESELDYLFQNGEIDSEQYQLLEELFSTLPFTTRSIRIPSLNNVIQNEDEYSSFDDSLEIQDLDNSSTFEILPYLQWLKRIKTSISYRMYHDLDADEARRQLVNISGRPDAGFSYYFEAEKNNDCNIYHIRKRIVRFSYQNLKAEIGNFNPSWGMGVTLGYYSDFLNKDDNPAYRSFLFPSKGRFNGVRLQYDSKISPIVMLSYDRSKTANARVAGMGVDYETNNLSMGILGNYHAIKNLTNGYDYSNLIIGNTVRYKSNKYFWQSELSGSEGKFFAWSTNFARKLDRGRFAISAWSYPIGYLNPYGGGKANSDYSTIQIEDTGLEMRSRQFGEWGILSQSQYILFENHLTSFAANYWRDGGLEEKFRMKVCDQFAINSFLDAAVTYLWGDDNLDEDFGQRQHVRFDLLYGKTPRNRIRFSTELKRIYYLYGRRDIARFELRAVYPISESINSALKFCRVDYDMADGAPGYWMVYLSEDITFGDYLFLRAVVDTREGTNYNMVSSARFTLQIILTAE